MLVTGMREWSVDRIFRAPAEALTAGRAAIARAEREGSPSGIADAELVIGGAQAILGDLAAAERHLTRAQEIFESLEDEWGTLTAILRMNIVWGHGRMTRVAIAQLTSALARAREYGDPRLTLGLLSDLGLTLRFDRQFERGLTYSIEAHEIAEELGDPFFVLLCKVNLVSALVDQFDFDAAADLGHDCLAFVEQHPGFDHFLPDCYYNLGLCDVQRGHYLHAIHSFEIAAQWASRYDDFYSLFQSRSEEGRARVLAGDRSGAIIAFQQSLDAWSHVVTAELTSAVVLARWSLESLTGQWTRGTVDDLRAILGRAETEYKAVILTVYTALAESMEHFGDLAAANAYLRENARLQEAYWREVATAHSHRAAKALQTAEARRMAESERRQRQAIDEAMQRVVTLNAQNEALVTQLQAQSVILEQMAREDSLTNVGNRRHFDEQLQRELVRSKSFQRPFSLAMVDIDDFKMTNDRYTHIVGDEVLRTVARLIRANSRVMDFVARYGGEEFAVIFTEADRDDAEALTEKIRSGIEHYPWDQLAEGLSITTSIGLVTVTGGTDATAVVARADEMLYAAKRRGKNLTASGRL